MDQTDSSKSKDIIVMWKIRTWTFRGYVLPKPTVQSLATRTQDRAYLVDSRASVHSSPVIPKDEKHLKVRVHFGRPDFQRIRSANYEGESSDQ